MGKKITNTILPSAKPPLPPPPPPKRLIREGLQLGSRKKENEIEEIKDKLNEIIDELNYFLDAEQYTLIKKLMHSHTVRRTYSDDIQNQKNRR